MSLSRREFIAGSLIAGGLEGMSHYAGIFSGKKIAGEMEEDSVAARHPLRE